MNRWLETGLITAVTTAVTLVAYWLWIQASNWRLGRRARTRKRRSRP